MYSPTPSTFARKKKSVFSYLVVNNFGSVLMDYQDLMLKLKGRNWYFCGQVRAMECSQDLGG